MKNKSFLLGAAFFLAIAASFAFAFNSNTANSGCCDPDQSTCCGIPCTDQDQCPIPCCKAEAPKVQDQK